MLQRLAVALWNQGTRVYVLLIPFLPRCGVRVHQACLRELQNVVQEGFTHAAAFILLSTSHKTKLY